MNSTNAFPTPKFLAFSKTANRSNFIPKSVFLYRAVPTGFPDKFAKKYVAYFIIIQFNFYWNILTNNKYLFSNKQTRLVIIICFYDLYINFHSPNFGKCVGQST